MNIENMRILRDQLARLPDKKFNMGEIINHRPCGTVACIAGWAALLNGGPTLLENEPDYSLHQITGWARRWLGLRDPEARHLFYGSWFEDRYDDEGSPISWDKASRADAIAELDRLIRYESNRRLTCLNFSINSRPASARSF